MNIKEHIPSFLQDRISQAKRALSGQEPVDQVLFGSVGNVQSISAKVLFPQPQAGHSTTAKPLSTEVKFTDGTSLTYNAAKNETTKRQGQDVTVFPDTSMDLKIYRPGYNPQSPQQCRVTLQNKEMREVITNLGSVTVDDLRHPHGAHFIVGDNSVDGDKIKADLVDGTTIQYYNRKTHLPSGMITPFYLPAASGETWLSHTP